MSQKTKKYLDIIEEFSRLKIAVIGDFMLDRYILGSCDRISPEAPVPVINVRTKESRLGGAGNVAANLNSLGCQVSVFGLASEDTSGQELIHLLKNENIDFHLLSPDNQKITPVKTRIIADKQQVTRVDEEDKKDLSPTDEKKLLTTLQSQVKNYDAIILSDYGKGLLTASLTQKIIKTFDKPIIVDPKGNNYLKYSAATLVKPNFKEFKAAVNTPEMALNSENLEKYAIQLRKNLHLEGIVVTLGARGVFIQNPAWEYKIIPTRAKTVFDVSGAGDTFTALFTMSLCVDNDWFIAGDIANHGSGIVVGDVGTSALKKNKLIANIMDTL